MRKNGALALIIISVIVVGTVLLGYGAWYFSNHHWVSSGTLETLTIGMQAHEYATLIYIAKDQGFFTRNGLQINLRDYEAGINALQGMKQGEVDVSVSTEYPIVSVAFQKESISVIENINKFGTWSLLARKDRGVGRISDLKGKRIGVARGTIGEFYLGRFLNLNEISLGNVTLVNTPLPGSQDAILNGSVDAIITMKSNIGAPIEKRLGKDMIIWPGQNGQATYAVLACKNSWGASHPQEINCFLKSLNQAEGFIINHPAQARKTIQNRLKYSDAYMSRMWPNQQFSLSLDQSLITAMEDEARWMIKNNLTVAKEVPDFRDYISLTALGKVKPEAVKIIR